jgi:beta-lactamase regulating signal transducer with metallopeptidase domain
MPTTTNLRLTNIATRQQKTRVRDVAFALCLALVATLSAATVTSASHVASTAHVAER